MIEHDRGLSESISDELTAIHVKAEKLNNWSREFAKKITGDKVHGSVLYATNSRTPRELYLQVSASDFGLSGSDVHPVVGLPYFKRCINSNRAMAYNMMRVGFFITDKTTLHDPLPLDLFTPIREAFRAINAGKWRVMADAYAQWLVLGSYVSFEDHVCASQEESEKIQKAERVVKEQQLALAESLISEWFFYGVQYYATIIARARTSMEHDLDFYNFYYDMGNSAAYYDFCFNNTV